MEYAIYRKVADGKGGHSYTPTKETFTHKRSAYRRRNQLMGKKVRQPLDFCVQRTIERKN